MVIYRIKSFRNKRIGVTKSNSFRIGGSIGVSTEMKNVKASVRKVNCHMIQGNLISQSHFARTHWMIIRCSLRPWITI